MFKYGICDRNSIKEGGIWSCIGNNLNVIENGVVLILTRLLQSKMVIVSPRGITKKNFSKRYI